MHAFAQEQPPANAPETVEEAVNIDPAFVWQKVESWVVGFQKRLPNIVVALPLAPGRFEAELFAVANVATLRP